jgi:hypothetical protein
MEQNYFSTLQQAITSFYINGEHQESYYDDGNDERFESWLSDMLSLSVTK